MLPTSTQAMVPTYCQRGSTARSRSRSRTTATLWWRTGKGSRSPSYEGSTECASGQANSGSGEASADPDLTALAACVSLGPSGGKRSRLYAGPSEVKILNISSAADPADRRTRDDGISTQLRSGVVVQRPRAD